MLLTRSVFIYYVIIFDTRSWFEKWYMCLYYNLRVRPSLIGRTATATTNAKSRAFWYVILPFSCLKMLFTECGELWSG